MRKILLTLFGIVLVGSLYANTPIVSAHALVPRSVEKFLNENPNATFEEVEAFIQAQPPEVAEEYKDKDKVLKIITNRSTNFLDNTWDFLRLGVYHILSGIDHILFVISLLLLVASVREILKLTITFTIAHSITLLLAGAGILVLSPRIVEPIIALSISYVAITSVFFRSNGMVGGEKGKILSVFIFGLFHGLGFAGLLQEIHVPTERFVSSLLSFNIGIEIGQLFIVAMAFPILLYLGKKPWNTVVIKSIAVLISLAGIVWMVQRILG